MAAASDLFDLELPPQVSGFLAELAAEGRVSSRVLRTFLACDEVYVVTASTPGFAARVGAFFESDAGITGLRALLREATTRTIAALDGTGEKSAAPVDALRAASRRRRCACAFWHLAFLVLETALGLGLGPCLGRVFAPGPPAPLLPAAKDSDETPEELDVSLDVAVLKACLETAVVDFEEHLGAQVRAHLRKSDSGWLERGLSFALGLPAFENDADSAEAAASLYDLQLACTNMTLLLLSTCEEAPKARRPETEPEAAAEAGEHLALGLQCLDALMLVGDLRTPAKTGGAAAAGNASASRKRGRRVAEPSVATRFVSIALHRLIHRPQPPALRSRVKYMMRQRVARRDLVSSTVKAIPAKDAAAAGEPEEESHAPEGGLATSALSMLTLGLYSAARGSSSAPKPAPTRVRANGAAAPSRAASSALTAVGVGSAAAGSAAAPTASDATTSAQSNGGARSHRDAVSGQASVAAGEAEGRGRAFDVLVDNTPPLGLHLEQRYIRGPPGSSRESILRVNRVVEDGPVDMAGDVRVNDRLVSINGQSTEAFSLEEVGDLIANVVPGTPVNLGFWRRAAGSRLREAGDGSPDSPSSREDVGAGAGDAGDAGDAGSRDGAADGEDSEDDEEQPSSAGDVDEESESDADDTSEESAPEASAGGWFQFLGFGGGEGALESGPNSPERQRSTDGHEATPCSALAVADIPRHPAMDPPPVGSLGNPTTASPLTDQTLLLLLVMLQYHAEDDAEGSPTSRAANPFRFAVASLRDVHLPKNRREMEEAQERAAPAESNGGTNGDASATRTVAAATPARNPSPTTKMLAYCARGNFDGIIEEICNMLLTDDAYASSLLLYTLTQDCSAFLDYIRCSCDTRVALLIGSLIEAQFHATLVLNDLEAGKTNALATAKASGFRPTVSDLYILVIDTLILVQDAAFCRATFTSMELPEAAAAWLSDMCRTHPLTRALTPAVGSMSCGSALFMVTIVMLKYNLAKAGDDIYLLSNLFALLLNLCAGAENLHPHVTQRFFAFVVATVRDYRKITGTIRREADEADGGERLPRLLQRAEVVEETLRVLFKGLVIMLRPRTLHLNAAVVYNFLVNEEALRDLPEPLRLPSATPELAEPLLPSAARALLKGLVHYFNVDKGEPSLARTRRAADSLAKELARLTEAPRRVPDAPPELERLWQLDRDIAELNFVYEEAENAADFFRPQTWRVVMQRWPALWTRLVLHAKATP